MQFRNGLRDEGQVFDGEKNNLLGHSLLDLKYVTFVENNIFSYIQDKLKICAILL